MKKKIDRFIIEEAISEGPGGSVFRAQEQLPGEVLRPVALKVLAVSGNKIDKHFIEELQLLVSLAGHPNIATVYAMGITDGVPWIATEYVANTLTQAILETPCAPEHVAEMMKQVAGALSSLHSLTPPVLHNDLTPSNILIDRYNVYKITEFSMAGPATVERTLLTEMVRYAAPELLSRELGVLSPAADLYALGHIAYELALGGKLYRQQFPAVYGSKSSGKEGNAASWMAWHCSMETKPAPVHEVLMEFPKGLGAIIARLMNKRPSERYAGVADVLADLKRLAPESQAMPDASGAISKAAAPAPTINDALSALPHKKTDQYFLRLGGKHSGPYDLASLQRMLKQGQVSRLHTVSTDRITWQSITTVEGLVWN